MKYMKYIIILLIVLVILSLYNSRVESFYINTQITLYNFLYGNKVVPFSEIFPLKKYQFYDTKIYGPNRLDTIKKLYSKADKNCMKYAKRKYGPNKQLFKIKNFKPANINNKNYNACSKYTQRCQFWSHQNYIIPPCCARHLKELLDYIIDLFNKHKITYFIYYGTLLGAVRHKGIIPWDTDIDIYIDNESQDKLKQLQDIIHKNTHYKLVIVDNKEKPSVLYYSKINKIHIDIYKYEVK